MLKAHEVEVLRRSVAMSGSLPADQLDALIASHAECLEVLRIVAAHLDGLTDPFAAVRESLNALHAAMKSSV
jgi:hypothetical protein